MKHIFLIDELSSLNIKKDSSLFWALTLKNRGEEVFLLFESDLSITNKESNILKLFEFKGDINKNFYIENFEIGKKSLYKKVYRDQFYFRIDPPVNADYLRSSWILESLGRVSESKVTNVPSGTVAFNEKLLGFEQKNSLPTLMTSRFEEAFEFVKKNKVEEVIIKPLNGFSGMGVEKFLLKDFQSAKLRFKNGEKLIVQKFDKRVYEGEIRSIFWKNKHIGSMMKKPMEGSYLSNIAQGASFFETQLSEELEKQCIEICSELSDRGIDLIAFDILAGNISEVNITCPGLLVELSSALQVNVVSKFY